MTAKKAAAKKAVKKRPAKRAAKKTTKKAAAKKAVKKKSAPHKCPTPADWPDDELLAELIRRGLDVVTSAAFALTIAELCDLELVDDRHEALVALGIKLAAIIDLPGFAADPNAALVREFRTLVTDLIAGPADDDDGDDEEDDETTRWQKVLAGETDD